MADDGPILEPIGRHGPPLVWVSGLLVVLVAVVVIAIGGRVAPGPSAGQAVVASAPVPADSLVTTAPVTSPRGSSAPIWYRPSPWPMGEDGLAGGTVYSSPSPSPRPD